MKDGQAEALRSGMLAEYAALRSEIQLRIGAQDRALAGTVALLGSFAALLAAVRGDTGGSFLLMLFEKGSSPSSIRMFSTITAAFTMGVELLLGYWAYQLFMIFRIAHYLMILQRDYEAALGPFSAPVLSWDRFSSSQSDLSTLPWGIRPIVWSQPLAMFVLTALGVSGVVMGALSGSGLLGLFAILLTAGAVMAGVMLVQIHRWRPSDPPLTANHPATQTAVNPFPAD